jgi:hypothetical protein
VSDPNLDVVDEYRHAKLRLGGRTQGISGTVTFRQGVVSVQVRKWLPRFLGGGRLIEQVGGTIQVNISRILGTRTFVSDGTNTVVIAGSLAGRARLVTNFKVCGFEVIEFRESPLTVEMDYGKSRPTRT